MKRVDRKEREIEYGDVVAFDIPVFYGTEEHTNKMWDIFWGKAVEEGIEVDFCPITQREKAVYKYPENPVEVLIIRKHVDMATPKEEATDGEETV